MVRDFTYNEKDIADGKLEITKLEDDKKKLYVSIYWPSNIHQTSNKLSDIFKGQRLLLRSWVVCWINYHEFLTYTVK